VPGIDSSREDLRFGVFEVDVQTRELREKGAKVKLQQQPFELLLILLNHPGEVVTREELRQKLWPADVYVDFDRGLNKAMVKLRDALGDSSDSPLYIETLPRMGYRFLLPVNGETRTTEQTKSAGSPLRAEVNKPELSEVQVDEAARRILNRETRSWLQRPWLLLALGTLILISGVTATLAMRTFRTAAAPPIHSLAVLPLENLSGDAGQDYLANGMTDELITMLAKNSSLRIVSRTSVMQYKGAHRPLPQIARELGVDEILEGSVTRYGDQVHMTIQLIQAASDSHVWAESYNRGANEAVSLPRQAALTIAKQLHSVAVQSQTAHVVLPAAHDAYLHGRYLWFRGDNEGAGKYFRTTTELQPDYALAWAGLAGYYGSGTLDGEIDPAEGLPKTKAAALKAVELDDLLPDAHLTLGAAIFVTNWNWDKALEEVARATQLDPKFSEGYHFRAKILAALNRHQEAIEEQKKATGLDPFARPWSLGVSYLLARRYDDAISEAQQHLATTPSDPDMHSILSYAYLCKGMKLEAEQEYVKQLSYSGDEESAASVRRAFDKGGWRAIFSWQLSQAEKKAASKRVSPIELAYYHAQLGEKETALRLIEEGYRQRDPKLLWIQDGPEFDSLHSEGRYRSVIKRIGLPPAY